MKKTYIFKVKPGKLGVWKAWAKELGGTLRMEALGTLKEERVVEEACLYFNIEGVDYVVGFMDGEMLPANMDREINQKHKRMKDECLERVAVGEVLYSLKIE